MKPMKFGHSVGRNLKQFQSGRNSILTLDPNHQTPAKPPTNMIGAGLAIGIGVGVAIGSAMGNVSRGLAVGIALGIGIGTTLQNKKNAETKDD